MKANAHFSELITGIILFILSLVLLVFFKGSNSAINYPILSSNWISILLIIDYFGRYVFHDSFLPSRKNVKRFIKIAMVGFLGALCLEVFGMFLTKLWIFPFISLPMYLLLAPIGYSTYSLILLSLYELVKNLLKRKDKHQKPTNKAYRLIMYSEVVIGIVLAIIASQYTWHLLQNHPLTTATLFQSEPRDVAWWYTGSIALSLFFLLEFFGFLQRKPTLTSKLLMRNFSPVIGILITNFIAIIVFEYVNSFFGLWIFGKWPLPEITILHIPLVYLIVWQFQLPVLLSAWNLVLDTDDIAIW